MDHRLNHNGSTLFYRLNLDNAEQEEYLDKVTIDTE